MSTTRRPGSETRAEILRVALELFTERGFEGTSIRDLSEALGMTKSSLYYHFEGKEAIIQALLASRRAEFDELLAWLDEQEPGPDLLRRAALRWVESTGRERILGMRFAHANGPTMTRLAAQGGNIRSWFDEVITKILGPDAPMPSRLLARMAFDTVSAALFAAQTQDASEEDVLAAARAATVALTG
ncbi:TetR family transcriptional regulator [Actinoplanes ianthinogenes]|uniref:TetR family transcriptional regulator n=1 Tax=Actinoplanes ianthinogenes TaxID=122358 RepID=A0ABN6CMJ3_9ACTN|nr:TetR/AcrR family transcriptional regulator [Actinoplanes ianthinogenes]BCJ46328.1 TetR family transcriptional regulator [Actinoplanes ianthinogenes]GGR33534.1 TetR family transcriptional regulator [Actinoplanes ianthinogenes]